MLYYTGPSNSSSSINIWIIWCNYKLISIVFCCYFPFLKHLDSFRSHANHPTSHLFLASHSYVISQQTGSSTTESKNMNTLIKYPELQSLEKKINLTCSSSNWSPPNAETQGLIPPVPRAIKNRPTIDRTLHARTKITPLQNPSTA